MEPILIRSSSLPRDMLGRPPGGSALVEAPVLGALYNRLSHLAVEQIYWRTVHPLVRDTRAKTGLPPMPAVRSPLAEIHAKRRPILLGWSARVLPRDPRREGWMHTTGYWFLDHEPEYRPPARLRAFLEDGDPPISLGLGSISGIDSARTGRIAALTARALERTGQRGILLDNRPEGEGAPLADGVIRVAGEVPYDWLFGRVAVAVHHGGAGTVAAALRAGVPSVVIPVLPDQAFWAWRVAALGAGPRPIHPKRLTTERLSAAIARAATDPEMRRRCSLLAREISAEDGVGKAVEAFERHAGVRR